MQIDRTTKTTFIKTHNQLQKQYCVINKKKNKKSTTCIAKKFLRKVFQLLNLVLVYQHFSQFRPARCMANIFEQPVRHKHVCCGVFMYIIVFGNFFAFVLIFGKDTCNAIGVNLFVVFQTFSYKFCANFLVAYESFGLSNKK